MITPHHPRVVDVALVLCLPVSPPAAGRAVAGGVSGTGRRTQADVNWRPGGERRQGRETQKDTERRIHPRTVVVERLKLRPVRVQQRVRALEILELRDARRGEAG